MAQITGKENICFLLCPLRAALPYSNTFWEADNDANKNSALTGSAAPLGERIMNRNFHCREFSTAWRKFL
jgi:hypothetical protein